jgi:predicted signal transduction protein with EAL and GGDEF domain
MLIFFTVYYISGVDYFNTSLLVNAFALPVLYCVFAYISVRSYWKEKGIISFKEAFSKAFTPMFIGGLLSVLSMFVFLNFIDPDAKDLLNYQYVERQKSELNKEYESSKKILANKEDIQELERKYRERIQSFEPERVKDKDMLTPRLFSAYFAAILIFYLILSVFFGAFFRGRTTK